MLGHQASYQHAETQRCLSNKISPEEACKNIKTQLDDINGA